MSDSLFYVPDESAEAELGTVEVDFSQTFEHRGDAVVFNDGYYSRCHRRPGVGAVMRFTGGGTSSLHLLPGGESAAVVAFEDVDDAFVMGLVECYQYCFHVVNS